METETEQSNNATASIENNVVDEALVDIQQSEIANDNIENLLRSTILNYTLKIKQQIIVKIVTDALKSRDADRTLESCLIYMGGEEETGKSQVINTTKVLISNIVNRH